MKTVTKFFARSNRSDGFFEVEAETMDEARQQLTDDGFNGYVYEETYHLVSTTPHVVGEVK